jgi:hypothetical protein
VLSSVVSVFSSIKDDLAKASVQQSAAAMEAVFAAAGTSAASPQAALAPPAAPHASGDDGARPSVPAADQQLPQSPVSGPLPAPDTPASTAEGGGGGKPSDAPPRKPPKPAAVSPQAALAAECDGVITQFTHVPVIKEAIQQRDELQREFNSLKASKAEYRASVRVGKALQAAKETVAQQPLSEEDYLSFPTRHAALVQKVTATCDMLLENEDLDALDALAAKLEELQALDVSALPQNEVVHLPAHPAPISAEEGDEDCANDPVYVPPGTAEITSA